jgi:nicotinamide mononucleotide transporter
MSFDLLINNLAEIIGVVLAICYLLLAVRQIIWCWLAWILSSCLYLYVMFNAGLYMEAALQIFYVVMGFYGWMQWSKGGTEDHLVVRRWGFGSHLFAVSVILILTLLSGEVLSNYTAAAMPFMDALTTWGAIVTTYMVAKKLIENWIYWFVIDSISIYLFISRELYFTAVLFFIYLFIIIIGYRSWKQMELVQGEFSN